MSGVARSQRLIAFKATANDAAVGWACPDNHITLIKTLLIWNPTTAAGAASLIFQTAEPVTVVYVTPLTAPSLQAMHWEGFICLNPGDAVLVQLQFAEMSCWLSGAVLSGGPQFAPSFEQLPLAEPYR